MERLKNNKSQLTIEYLRSQLYYDENSGNFTWLVSNSSQSEIGKIAGCVDSSIGYRNISITIDGKAHKFKAHRLAWLYVYGVWPAKNIDHIDRNKLNNRISNLREATQQENMRNYTKQPNKSSRYLGVSWHKVRKKWQAKILLNNGPKYLGIFTSEEEAALAYDKAALERDSRFVSTNIIILG
jgi:hypothetical protein